MKHTYGNRRPLAVTIISLLMIVVCSAGLARHLIDFGRNSPFEKDIGWIVLVRAAGVMAGIFALAGKNWARWLIIAWMAYHVGLSFFHTTFELLFHILLLAVFCYFLFRPGASIFFRRHPARPLIRNEAIR